MALEHQAIAKRRMRVKHDRVRLRQSVIIQTLAGHEGDNTIAMASALSSSRSRCLSPLKGSVRILILKRRSRRIGRSFRFGLRAPRPGTAIACSCRSLRRRFRSPSSPKAEFSTPIFPAARPDQRHTPLFANGVLGSRKCNKPEEGLEVDNGLKNTLDLGNPARKLRLRDLATHIWWRERQLGRTTRETLTDRKNEGTQDDRNL